MGKEIRKETSLWGKERTFVYEDREKVAEITTETGWFSSKEVEVTRDLSGQKIAVTSEETKGIILPEKVKVTRDPQGRKLSETRYRNEGLLRDSAEEIHEGNRRIGVLKKGNTLKELVFGSKHQILKESSGEDVDLARRVSRRESSEPPEATDYSNEYNEGGIYLPPEATRQQEYTEEFVEIKDGGLMKIVDKRAPRIAIGGEEYLPRQEYERIKKKMGLHYFLGITKLMVACGASMTAFYHIGRDIKDALDYGWGFEILKDSGLEVLLILGGLFLTVNAYFNLDEAHKLKRELE